MDGFNKLGSALESAITTPMTVKRNEAVKHYYEQTMADKELDNKYKTAKLAKMESETELNKARVQKMADYGEAKKTEANANLINAQAAKTSADASKLRAKNKSLQIKQMAKESMEAKVIEELSARDELNKNKKEKEGE